MINANAGTHPGSPNLSGVAEQDQRDRFGLGVGTESYEPTDGRVLAVEPSATMVRQRDDDTVPVVRATAEALPAHDGRIALLTVHHWRDRSPGWRNCAGARGQLVLTFRR